MSADTEANPAVMMACSSDLDILLRYGRMVREASGCQRSQGHSHYQTRRELVTIPTSTYSDLPPRTGQDFIFITMQ